jgi:hypothetical protein
MLACGSAQAAGAEWGRAFGAVFDVSYLRPFFDIHLH